jgi:hypothetical protein
MSVRPYRATALCLLLGTVSVTLSLHAQRNVAGEWRYYSGDNGAKK